MLNPNMYGCAFYDVITTPKERLGMSFTIYPKNHGEFLTNAIH